MDIIHDILEILYFLSGITLAVCAILALEQIHIGKKQVEEQKNAILINTKRDALKTASEQICYYSNVIIPLQNTVDKKIIDENIGLFSKSIISFDKVKFHFKPIFDKNDKEKLLKISDDLLHLINIMDNFAVYFISGIADEQFAFQSISSAFCRAIKRYLPFILFVASHDEDESAILQLYILWNERIEKSKLLREKEKIEEKLDSINEKTIQVYGIKK